MHVLALAGEIHDGAFNACMFGKHSIQHQPLILEEFKQGERSLWMAIGKKMTKQGALRGALAGLGLSKRIAKY